MLEAFAPLGEQPIAALPSGLAAVQTVVVLRMATAGYATGPGDDPAHALWRPRLLGDLEIGQSVADALGIGGRVGLTLADAEADDGDNALLHLVADGAADGRSVTVRTVVPADPAASDFGVPYGSADIVFRGTVRRVEHAPGRRARLSFADVAERLAVPLQATRYLGTGGSEGPATLAALPKPVALGTLFNVTPVYLGSIDLGDGSLPTYQAHWRAVDGITNVRIRGVDQSPADPPGVGEFKAWDALGMFQIGSTADGVVTCDLTGDVGDAFVSTTAGIVERLVTSLGPQFSAADLQAESFSFADTDLPGAVGWFRGPQDISAEQALAEILAGSGAAACGSRAGTFRLFDPLGAAAAQFRILPGWVVAIEPVPLPAALRPLPNTVAVRWQPNWTLLADVPASVGDDARTQLAAAGGTARASSTAIAFQVLQQRELRLPGLYYDESDALVRAERWRDFFEASPRMFRITTDRYLGQIECGDVGTFAFPAFGLDTGAAGVVVGWREALAARRLEIEILTVPWIDPQALPVGYYDLDGVFDVTTWA